MKKGGKWKALLLALISCLLITVVFYPITFPVDERVEGVLLSQADQTAEPVQVSMQGQCQWKLFGEDTINVTLKTEGATNLELRLANSSEGITQYTDANGQSYEIRGKVHYLPFQDPGALMVLYPKTADGEQATSCLVLPATDRENALEILKKLAPEAYDSFANGAS